MEHISPSEDSPHLSSYITPRAINNTSLTFGEGINVFYVAYEQRDASHSLQKDSKQEVVKGFAYPTPQHVCVHCITLVLLLHSTTRPPRYPSIGANHNRAWRIRRKGMVCCCSVRDVQSYITELQPQSQGTALRKQSQPPSTSPSPPQCASPTRRPPPGNRRTLPRGTGRTIGRTVPATLWPRAADTSRGARCMSSTRTTTTPTIGWHRDWRDWPSIRRGGRRRWKGRVDSVVVLP